MFSGTGIQTIENINAPNTYPTLFSGVIGRIVIEKPLGSGDMILKGAISIMREFQISPNNHAAIDASNATLILACVSGASYTDPSYNCRVNLSSPLTIDNMVINPRQNAGFKIIGNLTVTNSLETRGDHRLIFQEGTIHLMGDLYHNNYFGNSTSGDPAGNGLIKFTGLSQQYMQRPLH